MRILFLTMYYKPDSAATGILMGELAEELTSQGHDVQIITSMPHYSTNTVWKGYRGKLWMKDEHGGVPVHRVWSYVPVNKDKLVPRFFSYLSFTVLSTIMGLTIRRPDIIVTPSPSPPLTNGASAFMLGKLRGIPFITNIQDIYPDVAIRMGVMKGRAIISVYTRLERFVYKHSRAITVISEGFQQNLIAKGVPAEKISVIPNFVDENFVVPHPRKNAFSEENGWNDKFVALFAGNVGMSQGLDTVIDAAQILKDIPNLLFVVSGNGASKPYLVERVKEMGLANVQFMPYHPYERVPELFSAADIGLVPLRRGFTSDSVPSKLFTIMGVARPVVASVDTDCETAQIIHKAGCGVCVEPEDAEALANAIREMYNTPAQARTMGQSGRKYVEKNYTRTIVAQRYQSVFERTMPRIASPVRRIQEPDAAEV